MKTRKFFFLLKSALVSITICVAFFLPALNQSLLARNRGKVSQSIQKYIAHPVGFYKDDALPEYTVYMTFDDGPAAWTDQILDILKQEGVPATFFITAQWSTAQREDYNRFAKYKKTLLRIVHEGHIIGNHTLSHRNLSQFSDRAIAFELDRNQTLLDQVLEEESPRMTLLRPPFGIPWYLNTLSSPSIKQNENDDSPQPVEDPGKLAAERLRIGRIIRSRGLIMLWSRHYNSGDSNGWVPGDWYEESKKVNPDKKEFTERAEQIYNRVTKKAHGKGMVMLFHDSHLTTVKALPKIIRELKERGYHFSTLERYVEWRWKKSSRQIVDEIRHGTTLHPAIVRNSASAK